MQCLKISVSIYSCFQCKYVNSPPASGLNFPTVSIQTKADGLREQITALQLALQEAREENSARTEHEAKLTSQFQVGI